MSYGTILVGLNEQTCRACLQNYENPNWLYDDVVYNEIRLVLWELLEEVTRVKCTLNESNTPTHLCEACTRRLFDAYDFIRLTEKSQQMIQTAMKLDTVDSAEPNDEVKQVALSVDYEEVETVGSEDENGEVRLEALNIVDYEEVDTENDGILIEEDSDTDSNTKSIELLEEEQHTTELPSDECQNVEVLDDEYEIYATQSGQELLLAAPTEHGQTAEDSSNETGINPNTFQSKLGTRLRCFEDYTCKCPKCPRVFAKMQSLERHIQRAHTEMPRQVQKREFSETEKHSHQETGIECKYCPRIFKRHDTLKRHLQAFHTDEVDPAEIADSNKEKKDVKRGVCPYCGVSFPRASLTIHIRRHTGEKPYKCDQCEKGFPRRQDLSIHMRQHTGERPSTCTVCGKSFISQSKLARHMRMHTGQRPYKCPRCDKCFVQSNDVKIHMRRHTGERPYQCGVCGDRFICGSQLTVHRKAKSHFEPDNSEAEDPYENSRVNKRRAKEMEAMRQRRGLDSQDEQALEIDHQSLEDSNHTLDEDEQTDLHFVEN